MIPTASPLRILDFAITKMDFELVLENVDSHVSNFFPKYDMDIDFDMFKHNDLKVFVRVQVNQSTEKLPGYSFRAEAACFFAFDDRPGIEESQKRDMEGFSTIYIALNSLRGLISNFTANAPFGKYILPSIDLNDLIKKKQSAIMAQETRSSSGTAVKKTYKKKK